MSNLPTGTVTFLFTDIEGSARLAQALGDGWEAVRARHHAILTGAIAAQEGYVFQVIGDAFCTAFGSAGGAVRAAIAAQVALQAEDWGGAAVRVRMGIHTGSASLQANGEYHGYLTLSRVQRLMSAGHGGQVLLSQATNDLSGDELPEGVDLRDMGQQRLKDLIRPEHIYQLVISGLLADFPPLRALDAHRHNLPAQLTSFIGRETEMAEVKTAVGEHRLVTLTGAGGTGKTRLSLQVGAGLRDHFPDGVWFVELAPLTDPDLIPHAILSALRLGEQPGKPALLSLIETLAETTSLLILDNCEHLIEACAKLADALLSSAPRLKILASSRESLGVKGEMAWYVPSLSLPDTRRLPPIDELLRYESVRLFVDRAALAQPRFTLTAENAPAVAQICFRLDGIPLAIELAAARVKALSVEQIAARLDDRFRLLTGGSRTALPRQQTLRALIDWSYNLLSDQEKTLLRRLAVFVGGWTLEAAERAAAPPVGAETNAFDVFDLLAHLVDKSLVLAEEGVEAVRYRLLETTRQYAREILLASGEMAACRDRHLAFFLTLAEQAETELHSPRQALWMARLASEHDNLASALEWALATQPEAGLHLAGALVDYWDTRGHFSEARKWLETALEATCDLAPTPARVKVTYGAMGLASRQGDIGRWRALLDEGLALAQALDYQPGIAMGLAGHGLFKLHLENDQEQAEKLFAEALNIYRQTGDRLRIGQALGPLAASALNRYDAVQAEALYGESLSHFRQVGDEREIAGALWNLAEVALWRRDYGLACSRIEGSLALYRDLEDKHGIATALRTLSRAVANQGEVAQARAACEQSVQIFRQLEDTTCLGLTLPVLARLLLAQGEPAAAARMISESITLLGEAGDKVSEAEALDVAGRVALAQGDLSAARQYFGGGLARQQEMNDRRHIPSLFEGYAHLLLISSRPADAVRLLAAASALRDELHLTRLEVEQADYWQALSALQQQMEDVSFRASWDEGRKLKIEEAMRLAA